MFQVRMKYVVRINWIQEMCLILSSKHLFFFNKKWNLPLPPSFPPFSPHPLWPPPSFRPPPPSSLLPSSHLRFPSFHQPFSPPRHPHPPSFLVPISCSSSHLPLSSLHQLFQLLEERQLLPLHRLPERQHLPLVPVACH